MSPFTLGTYLFLSSDSCELFWAVWMLAAKSGVEQRTWQSPLRCVALGRCLKKHGMVERGIAIKVICLSLMKVICLNYFYNNLMHDYFNCINLWVSSWRRRTRWAFRSGYSFTLGTTSNWICLGGMVKAGMAFWGVILWWQRASERAAMIY